MKWAVVLVVCSACDAVFGLNGVGKSVDAHAVDVPADVDCSKIADEDGDCIPDDVDNCPAIANTSQQDSDGDHVGDDCDPHRGSGNDVQRAFYSFLGSGAADKAAWPNEDPTSTAWSYPGDGTIVHTDTNDGVGEVQSLADYFDDEVTIEAGFTFHGWTGTSTSTRMEVWIDSPLFSVGGYSCYVTAFDNGSASGTFSEVQDAGPNAKGTDSPPVSPGDPIVIRLTRTRSTGQLACQITFPSTTIYPGPLSILQPVPPGGTDHVAVTAAFTSADVRYVLIYGQAMN